MDGEEKELLLLHFQTLERQIYDMEQRLIKKIDCIVQSIDENRKEIGLIKDDYISKKKIKWYLATTGAVVTTIVALIEKIKKFLGG